MSFFLDVLNPTIFIGELEIREPITSLTDFLTACVSGVSFFFFLFHNKNSKNKSFVFFKFYFLCYFIGMTSAAFLGHAFQAYLPKEVKIIGWQSYCINIFKKTSFWLSGYGICHGCDRNCRFCCMGSPYVHSWIKYRY